MAGAGHDRCIVALNPRNIDAWLTPRPDDLASRYALPEKKQLDYYEHLRAA